jgi:hypothetical protein
VDHAWDYCPNVHFKRNPEVKRGVKMLEEIRITIKSTECSGEMRGESRVRAISGKKSARGLRQAETKVISDAPLIGPERLTEKIVIKGHEAEECSAINGNEHNGGLFKWIGNT